MEYCEHGLMDGPVTCDQFLPVNRVRIAVEICYRTASFAENDDSRCHVPRVQLHFPKSIESTSRDIAKIQSCRSSSPQSLHLQRESYEVVQVIVRGLADVVRKSGHEERAIKMIRCGHGNGNSIEVRPMTDFRGEEFVSSRVVDHPNNPTPVAFYPDGHTVGGEPVGEVGRAIKWINHPLVAGWKLFGQPTFLGKDRMGREGVVDDVDDALLRPVVGVGDEVDDLLMFNAKTGTRAFR